MDSTFADILLPLPLKETYTYRVPAEFASRISPGMRVIVPFGRKKSFAGIVAAIHRLPPEEGEIRDITALLDDLPVVTPKNLELWKWMADYYICTQGEVMKAALPAGLRLESETVVSLAPGADPATLPPAEEAHARLAAGKISVGDLQNRLPGLFSFGIVRKLIEKGTLITEEELREKYKPRRETVVSLHPSLQDPARWEEALHHLRNAPRQKEMMTRLAHLSSLISPGSPGEIPRKEFLGEETSGENLLRQLVAKGYLVTAQREVSRLPQPPGGPTGINPLTGNQQKALTEIRNLFAKKQVVLLHGITASGKTEIYIHLIGEALATGRQVLYLVPEISLTPQIIARLQKAFGGKTTVYHSRMSGPERVEVWQKVLAFGTSGDSSCQVVLGARSALLLPFSRLGLIIVDEEHEPSYKQNDPAPRYHARDMAVVAGIQHQAPILLGSATPSFESYRNAKTGKYGLVTLPHRFGHAGLPEIIVADLLRARKRREMKSLLTPELYQLMTAALQNGEQVILFQNRRGYAPWVECHDCGWIPECRHCDVSLTYHRKGNQLVCHYCGYREPLPAHCGRCGSPGIRTRGFGTEKVEEEIGLLFPGARISRMDLDTTRSRHALDHLIGQLESGKTDILIGTQMVTKGLDLARVSVVGILNADNLLSYPDFRAHERAFQLLVQVSGRPGRSSFPGKVVLQTTQPGHPVIGFARELNYHGLFNSLMPERKLFGYPPWVRLVRISLKHRDQERVTRAAGFLAGMLRQEEKIRILGPGSPVVGRINLWHLSEIWLKVPREFPPAQLRTTMTRAMEHTLRQPGFSTLVIQVDVDAG